MGDTERNCVTITAMYRYVIVYVHEITCRRLPSITPPGYVVSLICGGVSSGRQILTSAPYLVLYDGSIAGGHHRP